METIGKYRVIRELGKGATATVYLCDDPDADRQVAVKVIRPELLGRADIDPWISFGVSGGLAALMLAWSWWLFERGEGLRT